MNQYVPKSEEDFPKLSEVKRILRDNRTRLPYIIEFSGLPKSGKTTIMRRTLRGLDRLGIRCSTITEAATTKIDRPLRADLFIFNMLCYFENLKGVVSESQRRGAVDVTLVDRGIVDSLVWFEFLSRIGLLQDDLRKRIEDFASLPAWQAMVNHVVYVKSDWRSYRARFLLDSPIEEQPTLSKEYFEILETAYNEVFSKLRNVRVQQIDGGVSATINADEVSAPDILRDNWVTAHNSSIAIIQNAFDGIIEDHVEFIAAVPANTVRDDVINGLRGESITEFVDSIFGKVHGDQSASKGPKVQYIERNKVENDLAFVQLIAGAFIRRNGRLLVLMHAATEKRGALRGKRSILVTGHVERFDLSLTSGAKNPIENCLFRELKEELTNIDWPKVRPRFALRMGDNDMGRKHLALIYEIESISRALGVSRLPGAGDFEPDHEFWELSEAKARIDEFDDWSRQIISWIDEEQSQQRDSPK
jgi:predicted NUDIX family phosphoesterase